MPARTGWVAACPVGLMYLHTLLVFALLFFRTDSPPGREPSTVGAWMWGVAWIAGYWLIAGGFTGWITRTALRRVRESPERVMSIHHQHHRRMAWTRWYLLSGFAALVYFGPWPELCYSLRVGAFLRILCDLLLVAPWLIAVAGLWAISFPVEREARAQREDLVLGATPARPKSRWAYVLFNLRMHVLIVVVPMVFVLWANHVAKAYAADTRRWLDWPFASELLLGGVALAVFVASPAVLKRVWATHPLEAGTLRDRLEKASRRIGLRYRDILVWRTDGLMVNAAVMGLFKPVRYVMLSDGLLATMSDEQIEAIFGHESGHVRRRHIEYFLLFAFVAMLGVSGVLEVSLLWLPGLSASTLEVLAGATTLVAWGLGFGFISRRFEGEADLFGAGCVSPEGKDCTSPCGVHPAGGVSFDGARYADGSGPVDRLCATGAAIFASALDRVAMLNGIDHKEPSWRHGSIGGRMRTIAAMSGDPSRVRRFRRSLRAIKITLVVAALGGGALTAAYVRKEKPRLLQVRFD